jgi:homoserine kinase
MTRMRKSVAATAPCSTANLGPGYDVFGLALDALEDKVRITKSASGSGITIRRINDKNISAEPASNSAGRVVSKIAHDYAIEDSLAIEIRKGVPAGYGVGSSAASAAAAALAMKTLYNLKIDSDSLVEYAAEGEIASAGTKHYDNVSASLLGGFVISSTAGGRRTFVRLEPPRDMFMVVAIPLSMTVPEKKTEVARSVLPKEVPLGSVVHNVSAASTIVAGFARKDIRLIARGIDDVIVEPARKKLIPGYDEVKQGALDAGALAATISGAGPSIIAFLKERRDSRKVAEAMRAGFSKVGIGGRTLVCRPSGGARLA